VEGSPEEEEEEEGERDPTKRELQRLNKSLLVSLLQLLDFLLQQPGRLREKLFDLREISSAMHLLLNSYRPFQARHQLAALLHSQSLDRRALSDQLSLAVAQTAATLSALRSLQPSFPTLSNSPISSSSTTTITVSSSSSSSILCDDDDDDANRPASSS